MGEVVQEPHLDAALHGAEQRGEHECPRVRLEADVVERDVERPPGLREEAGDAARDVGGPLAAVGERLDRDGHPDRLCPGSGATLHPGRRVLRGLGGRFADPDERLYMPSAVLLTPG